MTPDQVRRARFLLGWRPEYLARVSDVPVSAVITLERIGSAEHEYKRRIQAALEQAGVAFTNGDEPGVKLQK
jgi:hypothetical protein